MWATFENDEEGSNSGDFIGCVELVVDVAVKTRRRNLSIRYCSLLVSIVQYTHSYILCKYGHPVDRVLFVLCVLFVLHRTANQVRGKNQENHLFLDGLITRANGYFHLFCKNPFHTPDSLGGKARLIRGCQVLPVV